MSVVERDVDENQPYSCIRRTPESLDLLDTIFQRGQCANSPDTLAVDFSLDFGTELVRLGDFRSPAVVRPNCKKGIMKRKRNDHPASPGIALQAPPIPSATRERLQKRTKAFAKRLRLPLAQARVSLLKATKFERPSSPIVSSSQTSGSTRMLHPRGSDGLGVQGSPQSATSSRKMENDTCSVISALSGSYKSGTHFRHRLQSLPPIVRGTRSGTGTGTSPSTQQPNYSTLIFDRSLSLETSCAHVPYGLKDVRKLYSGPGTGADTGTGTETCTNTSPRKQTQKSTSVTALSRCNDLHSAAVEAIDTIQDMQWSAMKSSNLQQESDQHLQWILDRCHQISKKLLTG